MTTTDRLTSWLLEQIAEDEQRIERVSLSATGPWQYDRDRFQLNELDGAGSVRFNLAARTARGFPIGDVLGEYTEEFQPKRMRAECDAKRRRIELHSGEHECGEVHTGTYPDDPNDPRVAAGWGAPGSTWRHVSTEYFDKDAPCPTLRTETLPYSGRPGYREEWRP